MTDLNPFVFINSVTHNKKDLIRENPDLAPDQAEKEYNPFIVNRGLSLHPDCVLHANEMNRLPALPKDAQYRYYLTVLRPMKRHAQWPKANKDNTGIIELLQELYSCNSSIAKQYLKLLTPEQIEAIEQTREVGGTKGKAPKR